jgi:hypothetical protein
MIKTPLSEEAGFLCIWRAIGSAPAFYFPNELSGHILSDPSILIFKKPLNSY